MTAYHQDYLRLTVGRNWLNLPFHVHMCMLYAYLFRQMWRCSLAIPALRRGGRKIWGARSFLATRKFEASLTYMSVLHCMSACAGTHMRMHVRSHTQLSTMYLEQEVFILAYSSQAHSLLWHCLGSSSSVLAWATLNWDFTLLVLVE